MNQKIAVSVVFVAAMFMNIMDATIVNVALPTIGREFGVRADSVDTVAIAYLVSLAVFIPASGWLGDRFGGPAHPVDLDSHLHGGIGPVRGGQQPR
jgi:MFS family permease